MFVATKQFIQPRTLARLNANKLNKPYRGFRSQGQDSHSNKQSSPMFDRVSQFYNRLFSSCSSNKDTEEYPLKFREKSIKDRRLELGLTPTSPRIHGKLGSLPLAVVQVAPSNTHWYLKRHLLLQVQPVC